MVVFRLFSNCLEIGVRFYWRAFPKVHLIDPGFIPVYGGAVGELWLQSLPMTPLKMAVRSARGCYESKRSALAGAWSA
jgi:hypothetical protein